MPELQLFSAFLIGLAGSVHCVGMCGGIVSTFSLFTPQNQSNLAYLLFYNIGRISSYTLAGALTAGLGNLVSSQTTGGWVWLNVLGAVFLLLLACYMGGWWMALTHLEKLGSHFFRYIRPLSKQFLPMKSPLYALPYGFIWGWLPCGLVYSTLTWSLSAGSSLQGAFVMLSFGLGTLPALLTMGLSAHRLNALVKQPKIRQCLALLLAAFALLTLWQTIAGMTIK